MSLFVPNRYRGKLIVVEGIDGSGKSTQLSLLSHWLRSQGFAVAFSEWNSSPLVRETTRRGKKKEMFTPTTFDVPGAGTGNLQGTFAGNMSMSGEVIAGSYVDATGMNHGFLRAGSGAITKFDVPAAATGPG